MSHTYTSQLMHCAFSTKNRLPVIIPELRNRLHTYIGGIAEQNDMYALSVGGVADHVHILLSIKPTMSLSKAMQLIKGGSSLWVHETFPSITDFAWQEGYGAFSVGVSQKPDTIAYIENQEEHHRQRTFQEEYRLILQRHGIEWDERYVWG